jgi:tRNA pseudouridine32 synthase/23S rRNA pseudouridine746 synthase
MQWPFSRDISQQGGGHPSVEPAPPRDGADITLIGRGEGWVVVDKPPGMLSVPGKGPGKEDCAAARVLRLFPGATGPLVVHRLDMETSGLMVFGLTQAAQRTLSGQFERRETQKAYIALLAGPGAHALPDSGEVSLPVRADIENRPVQIVDHTRGREAVTRWRIVSREVDRVRVRFEPITGRTHQLRVHAAAGLRAPIIGDPLYGGEPAPRLMLHASELSFLDPGSGRRVAFSSAVPF